MLTSARQPAERPASQPSPDPSATPWLSSPAFADPWAPRAVALRRCPYCCSGLARDAKKCRECGEWVVGTSGGAAAALLRLLGWVWAALSAGGALGIWYLGRAARLWALTRAVDPFVTPRLLDAATYLLVGGVLLQGVAVGVALGVLASLAPRRPRWWT